MKIDRDKWCLEVTNRLKDSLKEHGIPSEISGPALGMCLIHFAKQDDLRLGDILEMISNIWILEDMCDESE